jgi:hypothetical protein
MILIKMLFRQHWWLGMIIGFSKVEGIIDWNRNRINLYRNYSNSHIRIWIIVKWLKKIWEWCYWVACSKTKSLQLDSLQNKLWKLNYHQNSDLDKFECTKCVHISNLIFIDPMMFYKLRGFQGLQICNFWINRTKDMNLTC